MSGAHRAAPGNPGDGARRMTRVFTTDLAPFMLCVTLGLIAFLGGNLELWGCVLLLQVVVLMSAIAQRRLDRLTCWLMANMLLVTTWQFVRVLARQHGWPAGGLSLVTLLGDCSSVAAGASIVAMTLPWLRSAGLWWRRRSA